MPRLHAERIEWRLLVNAAKGGGEGEAVVSGSKAGGDAVAGGVKPLLTGAGYDGGTGDGLGLL